MHIIVTQKLYVNKRIVETDEIYNNIRSATHEPLLGIIAFSGHQLMNAELYTTTPSANVLDAVLFCRILLLEYAGDTQSGPRCKSGVPVASGWLYGTSTILGWTWQYCTIRTYSSSDLMYGMVWYGVVPVPYHVTIPYGSVCHDIHNRVLLFLSFYDRAVDMVPCTAMKHTMTLTQSIKVLLHHDPSTVVIHI